MIIGITHSPPLTGWSVGGQQEVIRLIVHCSGDFCSLWSTPAWTMKTLTGSHESYLWTWKFSYSEKVNLATSMGDFDKDGSLKNFDPKRAVYCSALFAKLVCNLFCNSGANVVLFCTLFLWLLYFYTLSVQVWCTFLWFFI